MRKQNQNLYDLYLNHPLNNHLKSKSLKHWNFDTQTGGLKSEVGQYMGT